MLSGPRVWAEVDLAAIRHNVSEIRALVGLRVEVMPVVKADGYGHGILDVARAAQEAGMEWFGVATVAEGVALRKCIKGAAICVFAPFQADEAAEIILHHLTPFVSDFESARTLSLAAHRLRANAKIHLDIDTGMGRTGVLPAEGPRLASQIARLPAVLITGLATHFASADDDPDFTAEQLKVFEKTRLLVEATDTKLTHLHCANSAATLRYPESHLNLVRTGLLTYGIVPPIPADTPVPALQPALTLKTRIALIRTLPQGHSLSYGRTHTLKRDSRIATLPVGYGDGYPRGLSNNGYVLIGGQFAPIVGRVCMDMTLVDVSEITSAEVGGEVVLIGKQGNAQIRVEDIACAIQTTEHEITTRLGARVPRIHLNTEVRKTA